MGMEAGLVQHPGDLARCSEILADLGSVLQGTVAQCRVPIQGYSIDTRSLQPGDLFIALPGTQQDGHRYVAEAFAKGAVGALVSESVGEWPDKPLIQISDTAQALGYLGAWTRAQFSGVVVGLTGSAGKTSTKEWIAAICRNAWGPEAVLWTQGTLNNHLGVPLTLLRLQSAHRGAVIEMGANRQGDIDQLANWVKPQIGLITNAYPVHLEGFGSLDGVVQGKGELLDHLAPDGCAVLFQDSPYRQTWQARLRGQHVITFGQDPAADFRAEAVVVTPEGTQFTLQCPLGRAVVHLSALGAHQVNNALAAAATAAQAGVGLSAIVAGLEQMRGVEKRMMRVIGPQGSWLINDAYNANPTSVKAALDYVAQVPKRRILVFSDMWELGEEAPAYHRQVGEYAAQVGIDGVYIWGQYADQVAAGFAPCGRPVHVYATLEALIAALRGDLDPETVVLAKASKRQALWRVIEQLQESSTAHAV